MESETTDDLLVWYIRQWCLMHQVALIIKKQLELLGSHFGDVAKFIHVWRSPAMPTKLRQVWIDKCGLERANKVCRSIPCKPLKGLWGAITKSEDHIVRCGPHDTRMVFDIVVAPKALAKSKASGTGPKAKGKPKAKPIRDQDQADALVAAKEEASYFIVTIGLLVEHSWFAKLVCWGVGGRPGSQGVLLP